MEMFKKNRENIEWVIRVMFTLGLMSEKAILRNQKNYLSCWGCGNDLIIAILTPWYQSEIYLDP